MILVLMAILATLSVPWFVGFLFQINELHQTDKLRKTYELKKITELKKAYNFTLAIFWFLWIWFPIKERIYYS